MVATATATQHDAERLRLEGLISIGEVAAGMPAFGGRGKRQRGTVLRWIKAGKLEAVCLPSGHYTSWAAVDRMLARGMSAVDQPMPTRQDLAKRAAKADAARHKLTGRA